MRRRLNLDPLAVTSTGTVLVNLARFDGPRRAERLLKLAQSLRGSLFVGVELSRAEVRKVFEHLRAGHTEAAAFLIGKRQKRSQRARP